MKVMMDVSRIGATSRPRIPYTDIEAAIRLDRRSQTDVSETTARTPSGFTIIAGKEPGSSSTKIRKGSG